MTYLSKYLTGDRRHRTATSVRSDNKTREREREREMRNKRHTHIDKTGQHNSLGHNECHL
jgi:hypothetical protein